MKVLSIVWALILSINVSAQELAELQLLYLNSDGSKPMQGEAVTFTDQNGKLLVAKTDVNGKANLDILQGSSYTVSVMYDGEKSDYDQKLDVPSYPGQKFVFEYKLYAPSTVYLSSFLLDVHFETAKSNLSDGSESAIDQLYDKMKDTPSMKVEIAGHTDNQGSDASNLVLSQKRAEVVRQYLITKGVAASRIKAKGYGETEPVKTNDTSEGRAMNRRTEVRVTSN